MTVNANRLVAVVGATGTGKSQFSLNLARSIHAEGGSAEIVNADAMQLYRGMDIGTAKLTTEERAEFPHHMFDVLDVTQEASVADYQTAARAVIDGILARGATPILVGGSGLYVSSVLFEFDFPGHDDEIRERLEAELAEKGPGLMFAKLKELAPQAAERIDSQNARRVVRALEVIEMTGDPAALGTLPEEPVYWRDTTIYGLREEREVLVERLDARVEKMWADGILDEVRGLIPAGIEQGVTARRAIGYAQALGQLAGELTEAEAIAETQALTRRYARRQVSWFKRYADVQWVSAAQ
jgi:tRNA dimethylallyltransferase